MCGIVGYIGQSEAVPVLLDGLNRLSYRGYDSAGIAILSPEGKLQIRKTKGKLDALKAHLSDKPPAGSIGIGHTRWATHGEANDLNAHPHADQSGGIAVVHNGIIENYRELRSELEANGSVFRSETDTEAAVQLLASLYDGDMCATLRKAMPLLRGSFALAVLCAGEADRLFCARRGSPLVIGQKNGEGFLASDLPALLSHTRDVVFLEDDEVAVLDGKTLRIWDARGEQHTPSFRHVQWEAAQAEKEGFAHFMRKEIHEQPSALRRTLEAWASPIHAEDARMMKKLTIVACGSACHAGLIGKHAIERLARLPVEVEIASEYRYRSPLTIPDEWMIAISQSGETADTLAAAEEGLRRGARVLALCNTEGSSLSRLVGPERTFFTHAGPEMAVASTKAFLTQAQTLMMLAISLGRARGTLDDAESERLNASLARLAEMAQEALETEPQMQKLASQLKQAGQFFFIGRGMDYALAMEAALKTKEICYIPSEAFASGELKHGPIALLHPGQTVISTLTQPSLLDKSLSNLQEAASRGARLLIVCTRSLAERAAEASDTLIVVPDAGDIFSPLLAMIPLQLLAYHMAVQRGCDVDQPRNLAKSVTVE